MKDKLIIIGGLVCAGTCIIPIINKSGDYSMLEIVINSAGQYIGSGIAILGSSFYAKKNWPYLRTISAVLISIGFIWIYDNFLDLSDEVHTYHYTVILGIITITTLSICLLIRLRRR